MFSRGYLHKSSGSLSCSPSRCPCWIILDVPWYMPSRCHFGRNPDATQIQRIEQDPELLLSTAPWVQGYPTSWASLRNQNILVQTGSKTASTHVACHSGFTTSFPAVPSGRTKSGLGLGTNRSSSFQIWRLETQNEDRKKMEKASFSNGSSDFHGKLSNAFAGNQWVSPLSWPRGCFQASPVVLTNRIYAIEPAKKHPALSTCHSLGATPRLPGLPRSWTSATPWERWFSICWGSIAKPKDCPTGPLWWIFQGVYRCIRKSQTSQIFW